MVVVPPPSPATATMCPGAPRSRCAVRLSVGGDYEPAAELRGVTRLVRRRAASTPATRSATSTPSRPRTTSRVDRPDERSNWPRRWSCSSSATIPTGEASTSSTSARPEARPPPRLAADGRRAAQGFRRRRVRQPRLVDTVRRHRPRGGCRSVRTKRWRTPSCSTDYAHSVGPRRRAEEHTELGAAISLETIGSTSPSPRNAGSTTSAPITPTCSAATSS